jgi:hypothetical protein
MAAKRPPYPFKRLQVNSTRARQHVSSVHQTIIPTRRLPANPPATRSNLLPGIQFYDYIFPYRPDRSNRTIARSGNNSTGSVYLHVIFKEYDTIIKNA